MDDDKNEERGGEAKRKIEGLQVLYITAGDGGSSGIGLDRAPYCANNDIFLCELQLRVSFGWKGLFC